MSTPKISVITTSFNQGRYIRQNIESVLQQEYPNFEHIVIDGGSNDETVSVLKSYPHLKWVSEADEGQSDALNKGLKQATGDIIAWLNSDDWYCPRIFHDVAQALRDYPIVIGPCILIDKDEKPIYQVENLERHWFDMLKYWVPYSIPCQPSIFFMRELLEEFKRHDNSYIDKELYYVMDYDLWLRIARRYPLVRRINKPLSFYRMTDSNKTSLEIPGMAYAEPEMSRVFHRHINGSFPNEKACTILIPAEDSSYDFVTTLECAASQTLLNFEIVIADFSGNKEQGRVFKDLVKRYNSENHKRGVNCYMRYLIASETSMVRAICDGIEAACSPLSIVMQPGTSFQADFTANAISLFSNDRLALAHPFNFGDSASPGRGHFANFILPNGKYRLEGFMCSPPMLWCSIVRNAAWRDVRPLGKTRSASLLLREFMLRLNFSGWQMIFAEGLKVDCQQPDGTTEEPHQIFGIYTNSEILTDMQRDFFARPFTQLLVSGEICGTFHPELAKQYGSLLTKAPPDWHSNRHYASLESLENCVRLYPDFAPPYYYLAQEYGKIGDKRRSLQASEKLARLNVEVEIY